jgi:hypothetical protein
MGREPAKTGKGREFEGWHVVTVSLGCTYMVLLLKVLWRLVSPSARLLIQLGGELATCGSELSFASIICPSPSGLASHLIIFLSCSGT